MIKKDTKLISKKSKNKENYNLIMFLVQNKFGNV